MVNFLKCICTLTQHINKPTRNGTKLIDHIITNIDKVFVSDVLPCDEISDHDAPYIVANIRKPKFEPRYKYIRMEKNFDKDRFKADVASLPLNIVYGIDDPEEQLDIFNEMITSCLNEHAPLKKVKITRPPAPWLKHLSISNLQEERDRARKKAHKTLSEYDWIIFRNIRNKLKKHIKSTKTEFLRKALSSKRPKEVWSIINRILHPSSTKIDAKPTDLNVHFNTTAKRLLNSIDKPEQHILSVIDKLPQNDNSFTLSPASYQDVNKAIKSIREDCSTGDDNLPSKYLKLVIEDITSPICHIINECIKRNIFPNQWKISRISPIPKISKPLELNDYRPISILPVLSKVYERIILSQIVTYIESHHLLSEKQSGFRKGHSTITTALKLRDDILKAMNKGEIMLSVMADYSKAFDTVDFQTLIMKLHQFNFSKDALLLLTNYLSNRYQYVQVHETKSNKLLVTNGVPQGSILGPILFNIYVADMNQNIQGNCLQYADDTNLYYHTKPKDLSECVNKMNIDLKNLINWSNSTNLIFNSTKTKTLLFSTLQMGRTHLSFTSIIIPSVYL